MTISELTPPWPHQEILLNKITDAAKRGIKKLIAVSPTGSGKTYLIFSLIERALRKGRSVLLIVPLDILSDQVQNDAKRYGIPFGMLQAGYPENRTERLQISTYQSLNNRDFPPADLVIIDEVHLCGGCHLDVLASYPFIIGFTATPARTDRVSLLGEDRFQALIEGSNIKSLTPQFLVPYQYFAIPLSIKREDEKSLDGSIWEHWSRLASTRQTILFGKTVEHSKHMAEFFRNQGVSAIHLDKDTKGQVRRDAVEAFKRKEIQVLCNFALFGLGFNVPGVQAIIHARRTKSLIFYRQANGRGFRVEPGKVDCIILDHVGNVDLHGMPDEEVDWMEYNIGKKFKPKSKWKRCPKCYLISPISASVCEFCHAVFSENSKREPLQIVESSIRLEKRTKAKRKVASKTFQVWSAIAEDLGKSKRWSAAMNHAYVQNNTRYLTERLLKLYDEKSKEIFAKAQNKIGSLHGG